MNFMLDIETLDVKPSSIVLSVGLVAFDSLGEIDTFYGHLEPEIQAEKGRTVSVSTVEFWLRHTSVYPWHDRQDPIPLLLAMNKFIQKYAINGEIFMWAKPPSFDFTIMESLYNDFKIVLPWNYRAPRCVRTAQSFLTDDEVLEITSNHKGTAHNAIEDCRLQIAIVNKAKAKCRV